MNEAYNSGYLLRALWRLDHLCPIWVNGSTNNFITSRGSSKWCKVNEVLGRFLDKQDIIQVFLGLQKTIKQHIVLPNILWINTDHVSFTRHIYWLLPLGPLIVLRLACPEYPSAALLECHCLSKQWHQKGHLLLLAAWSPLQFKHLKVWGQAPVA